ncbi:MAG: hypothetical protein IPJ33_00140 [Gammaproteobacteria bacterium]|nr:hypothetical protein [Gammaproteobacteria bacterium]
MTNPVNDKLAATHVHKTVDLYSGPCCGSMPDVIINWDPEAKVMTQLATSAHGTVSTPLPGYAVTPYYSGNHRGNAFIAALGTSVEPGSVLEGASILDLAPSILAHFGVEVPGHMDGKVVGALARPKA